MSTMNRSLLSTDEGCTDKGQQMDKNKQANKQTAKPRKSQTQKLNQPQTHCQLKKPLYIRLHPTFIRNVSYWQNATVKESRD